MAERSHPDLIVVGDVMVDVSVESGHLASGGDVHGHVRLRPGGSGANAAVWAAEAGIGVRLHGRVGDDLPGRLLTEAVRSRGVEASLAVDPVEPTGAMLVVRERGNRSMVASRGANAGLAADDLPERLEAGAVLVSGYLLFHGGSEAAALAALERASAPLVAIEAASWPLVREFGADRFMECTGGENRVLLANEREAETLTGLSGEEAALELSRRYRLACVKLGKRGALLAEDGVVRYSPAPRIEEADPTGAGDAFDGWFLAAVVGGRTPGEALSAACKAGSRAAASLDNWPGR